MKDDLVNGDRVNALLEAAYRGRIGRRAFLKALLAAGFGAAAARELAEHAALAQSNQAARLAELKDEYDYLIVGGGTAGCVLAHRLSQDGRSSVLVIEGGGADLSQPKTVNPLLWPTNIGSDTDWGNRTLPQAGLANRVIPVPVGKIIGGGSSINGLVWLRGDKSDFDAWEAAAGPDWGFAAIAHGFLKVDRCAGGDGPYRSGSGMIANRKPAPNHVVTRAFIEASKDLGFTELADVNGGPSPIGTGQMDQNIDGMRRVSAAQPYLLPALERRNLTLLPGATVTRLAIESGRCRGVVASLPGGERRFSAAKETLLCAGALHSPKLLMLSGVGPAEHLRSHGIRVAYDAPNVGANLHDHLLVRVWWRSSGKMPPMEDTHISGITYTKSRASLPGPDIQVFARHDAAASRDLKLDEGYVVLSGLTKVASRGTVRLGGADMAAPLAINPNYLGEAADVDALVASIELGLAIGNGRSLAGIRQEQLQLRAAAKAQIAQYARETALTYFHYAGTCAMGKSRSAPVDEALRVRGVEGLRVVDASVIPELPCSNTNAPVLSLAERAAELIAG